MSGITGKCAAMELLDIGAARAMSKPFVSLGMLNRLFRGTNGATSSFIWWKWIKKLEGTWTLELFKHGGESELSRCVSIASFTARWF
jgi:hypothetical protein